MGPFRSRSNVVCRPPSGTITNAKGQSFSAGKLGKYKVGSGNNVLLGKPFVFNKHNVG